MSESKQAASSSSASAAAPPPAAAASSADVAGGLAALSLDADENPSASSSGPPPLITLVSQEGRRFPVSRSALLASELCATTLEGDQDAREIPLYHIEGDIVQKVIDYLTYHEKVPPRKIEKPLVSSNMRDLVDKWDVAFIEGAGEGANPAHAASSVASSPLSALSTPPPSASQQEVLFKLLLAANYLNIKSLLQLTCAKVASLMKGKTPQQIREVFGIRNDYTQAEEEEVRKEYKDLIG